MIFILHLWSHSGLFVAQMLLNLPNHTGTHHHTSLSACHGLAHPERLCGKGQQWNLELHHRATLQGDFNQEFDSFEIRPLTRFEVLLTFPFFERPSQSMYVFQTFVGVFGKWEMHGKIKNWWNDFKTGFQHGDATCRRSGILLRVRDVFFWHCWAVLEMRWMFNLCLGDVLLKDSFGQFCFGGYNLIQLSLFWRCLWFHPGKGWHRSLEFLFTQSNNRRKELHTWNHSRHGTCTPPKFNMEPENQPQEEEIPFGNNHS